MRCRESGRGGCGRPCPGTRGGARAGARTGNGTAAAKVRHSDATAAAFKGTLLDAGMDADGNIIITVRRRYGGEDIVRGMQRLRGGEYVFKIIEEV